MAHFVLGLGVKAAIGDSSATAAACNLSCQSLLHLPLPATAGLVHSPLCRMPDYAESVHETSGSRFLGASACGITQSTAANRYRCLQACVQSTVSGRCLLQSWSDPAERGCPPSLENRLVATQFSAVAFVVRDKAADYAESSSPKKAKVCANSQEARRIRHNPAFGITAKGVGREIAHSCFWRRTTGAEPPILQLEYGGVKDLKEAGRQAWQLADAEQGQANSGRQPSQKQMKGKRDRALLALLLACGLRPTRARQHI